MSDLFSKLASEEKSFTNSHFMGPVLAGQKVRVRIAGIVMSLSITQPEDFSGWGVFRPLSYSAAVFEREPNLRERNAYLDLFPVVRLVVAFRAAFRAADRLAANHGEAAEDSTSWYGLPATQSDTRFGATKPVRIPFASGCEVFDTIQTRFDGQHYWFEKKDNRRPPRIAKQLRDSLQQWTEPKNLDVAGCTVVEQKIYEHAFTRILNHRKGSDELKIETALKRGGADFVSYREVGNGFFSVAYRVNGELHRSTVERGSLSVHSAGICLDGFDANFDLQSLVGVIQEGQATNQIHRV